MSMLVMSHSSSELVSPSFQEGMAAVELPQRKSPPASQSREESESESRDECGQGSRVRGGRRLNERASGCGPTAPVGPSNGR
jgi:hypothetical protein